MNKNCTVALAVFLLSTATVYACNIPVFRYALERWQADTCELLVFHDGPFDEVTKSKVDALRQRTLSSGGHANVQLQLIDVRSALDSKNIALWHELKTSEKANLPYSLIQTPHTRGPMTAWHGPLDRIADEVFQSPLRTRLKERLLNGDSIVWLVLKSPDEARNSSVRKLIGEQSAALARKMVLPEGIGLAGSELHSEVPLFLKFTSLEIDRQDPQEQFLVRVFSNIQQQAFQAGQPLVIPVFGRGRALEVIPAEQLDEKLFEELTLFLCGACSCQVKESNPGFDLLISADWNSDLFGENGTPPPPSKSGSDASKAPKLLPIAPGRKK